MWAVKAPTIQRSYSCHPRSSIASAVHSPFMKLPFRLPLGAPGLWPRKEGACRDTAGDAMLGGHLTTLGTQLCGEITLRTLTLPESDYPAGR
jgi:hypothetical protein